MSRYLTVAGNGELICSATSDDWQLFEEEGHEMAAIALNDSICRLLRGGFLDRPRMLERVIEAHAEYGASDSEGFRMLDRLAEEFRNLSKMLSAGWYREATSPEWWSERFAVRDGSVSCSLTADDWLLFKRGDRAAEAEALNRKVEAHFADGGPAVVSDAKDAANALPAEMLKAVIAYGESLAPAAATPGM